MILQIRALPTDPRMLAIVALLDKVAAMLGWHLAAMLFLRLFWLLRPDPFGQPLVGKPEWYIFHCLAYDSEQAADLGLYALPLVLALGMCRALPRWDGAVGGLVAAASALLVLVGQVDFEVMRFVGTHASWQLASTYTNGALLEELPRLLRYDAGGAFLPFILLVTALPAQAWLQRLAWRKIRPQRRWPRRAVALALGACVGYVFAHHIWQGAAWKVVAPIALLRAELHTVPPAVMPQAERTEAASQHQARWRAGNPQSDPIRRRRPSTAAPKPARFVRASAENLGGGGAASGLRRNCASCATGQALELLGDHHGVTPWAIGGACAGGAELVAASG